MFVGYSDPLNPNGSDKDLIFLNEFSGQDDLIRVTSDSRKDKNIYQLRKINYLSTTAQLLGLPLEYSCYSQYIYVTTFRSFTNWNIWGYPSPDK